MKIDEKCVRTAIPDAADPPHGHGIKSTNSASSTPLPIEIESQRTVEPSFAGKMRSMAVYWLRIALFACLVFQVLARSLAGSPTQMIVKETEMLQNIVTWDERSLFVHGKRIMFFSGEFHPWRLPVPGLWLDVFQKIRSMGYTGVSFYVHWALLEGKPGDFSAEGVFAYEPFFEAATKAGIYLLARPGPYINAEATGGGFPSWTQLVQGKLRTPDKAYLEASDNYVSKIGGIIAKAQITNGGPVILLQPENEYTGAAKGIKFPDPEYMEAVYAQYRKAGIVVPFISNDAHPAGYNAPGQPAPVDIYGHDGYPLGFNCTFPGVWKDDQLPTDWRKLHLKQSPKTPYSLIEFQGGSFDPWGGVGYEKCTQHVDSDFQRVFYKNDYSFGVTIFNIYMTYGGTNWGNLGHPGGYTSYDYGTVITEDRLVNREKYSDAKLQATFITSSPAYLEATAQIITRGELADAKELAVTPLKANKTQFLVVRHDKYNSKNIVKYKLKVSGGFGAMDVPQTSGSLTLRPRDSKIHVVDYDVGGINVAYSTAEIFTWKSYPSKTVLVVYADQDEPHEIAFSTAATVASPVSPGVTVQQKNGLTIVNWEAKQADKLVKLGKLHVYLVERHSAYNMWVLGIPSGKSTNTPYTGTAESSAIIKGGYLMRTAIVKGDSLFITGDLNATTPIQVLGGAPEKLSKLNFNGKDVKFQQDADGVVTATVDFARYKIKMPQLSELPWKVIDSLPEIQPGYSDSKWTVASHTKTPNTAVKLLTPTSLFASDYGYNLGYMLFRGSFKATGAEKTLTLLTRGGAAYGMSAWLGDKLLGTWAGIGNVEKRNTTFSLPGIAANTSYIVTVVIDNMGLDQDWTVGSDQSKNPIGILDYSLSGRDKSAMSWKLTGNFKGENYVDRVRGPTNEGGLYVERQGFHLPAPPSDGWKDSKGPTEGISRAGIAFYSTSFDLAIPRGYDLPLALQVGASSAALTGARQRTAYRLQLYVNGWQFGKYVNNIGPQTKFPVPEGIWNYRGRNYVGVSLWALDAGGAKVDQFELVNGPVVYSGMEEVKPVNSPKWVIREGSY